jgi:NAD(P)-dependent dehydrogenase (short-subunit alcohol dehydrogenase family)
MSSTNEIAGWTAEQIPHQAGRLAVVTGAVNGLGYATALALAKAGADVILAGEGELEGLRAVSQIRPLAPLALVRFEKMDSQNLASVTSFAARLAGAGHPVDLLITHPGGAVSAERKLTADGFELQFGANYLSRFALTAQLLPLLRRSRKPRVVHVSSLSHRQGSIHFRDLEFKHGYDAWAAHCQAMLATVVFTRELQRRCDAQGWNLVAAAAHPGNVRPKLIANGNGPKALVRRLHGPAGLLLSQSAENGALPALYAATAREVQRGGFYGPGGPFELIGPPELVRDGKSAPDLEAARRLWKISEQLTGVKWP